MQKLTIKQIKQAIEVNVSGVIHVEKQHGTNLWYIQMRKYSKEITVTELDELGLKIISVNKDNGMVLVELDKDILPKTYYGRQVKHWGR